METEKTAKEIAKDIIRKKYEAGKISDLFVICSKETLDILSNSGMVRKWKENYPGALVNHTTVCGIELIGSDCVLLSESASKIGYEVVTEKECKKRLRNKRRNKLT